MKNTIIISVVLVLFSLNLFGQSSFKDYKDEKTGKRTTYADGLLKEKSTYYNSSSKEVVAEIYPMFKNGSYYLIMSNYEMPSGKYLKGSSSPFEQQSNGSLVYLTISINDGEKVISISARLQTIGNWSFGRSKSDYKDLEYKIQSSHIIKIALARKLDIKVTLAEVNIYKDFDYSFTFEEVKGFRDFAEGMKLITKN